MQFLNQHTSKYQKRSKCFVCTRLPGSSMFALAGNPNIGNLHRIQSPKRSPMGLSKSGLNREVTVLQGAKLHCGINFGTANG